MNIDQANRTAVERMTAARPVLTGLATARDVVPGLEDGLLLHAGPPIEWERASGPLRGAVIGALIFEGQARDEAAGGGSRRARRGAASSPAITTPPWARWRASSRPR